MYPDVRLFWSFNVNRLKFVRHHPEFLRGLTFIISPPWKAWSRYASFPHFGCSTLLLIIIKNLQAQIDNLWAGGVSPGHSKCSVNSRKTSTQPLLTGRHKDQVKPDLTFSFSSSSTVTAMWIVPVFMFFSEIHISCLCPPLNLLMLMEQSLQNYEKYVSSTMVVIVEAIKVFADM
jgi:hypothetical protein